MTISAPPYFFVVGLQGMFADMPPAADYPVTTVYWATDSNAYYVNDGSAWNAIGGGGGSGTVTDVTSGDSSILVTDPTTTPDLSVQNSPAVGGVTVTGTPTAGQVIKATSPTAADWDDESGTGFTGWTEDASDPANVDSQGGNLALSGGTLSTDDGTSQASIGSNEIQVISDTTPESYSSAIGSGNVSIPPSGVAAYNASNSGGATVAFDGGGMLVQAINGLSSQPAASSSSTLALGTAYQNTLGYDVFLTIYLSVTANVSGVIKLGVGPTATPTQQTLISGVTATGIWTIPIMLPDQYYALLSNTGTITVTVDGQIAMPI